MVPEAPLEQTEHGLLPRSDGWFVLNAREAPWMNREGARGMIKQGKADFSQLGVGLVVLEPGEPMSMYHWETDQEDFLVLSGEALAIVEGEERPLRQWDLVHCPAGTKHVIVGAGAGPCVVFTVGARWNHTYRKPDGTTEVGTTGVRIRSTRPPSGTVRCRGGDNRRRRCVRELAG